MPLASSTDYLIRKLTGAINMGLFSKKADFITAGPVPDGYVLIDLVTSSGFRGNSKKALRDAKADLQNEAHKLGADAIANFNISMVAEGTAADFISVITYGDAIKKV